MTRAATVLTVLFTASLAAAQATQPAGTNAPAANPHSTAIQQQAKTIQGFVLRAAEKVPEEHYSFKPTEDVRTIGALLGHIADANMLLCRIANGETPKMERPNESKTAKADLIAALKESSAFCESVAQKITDANGAEAVKLFGQQTTRLGAFAFNTNHAWEHYGNLVTYMRLKNIVPPTSERTQD